MSFNSRKPQVASYLDIDGEAVVSFKHPKKCRNRFKPSALAAALTLGGALFAYGAEAAAELTATSNEPAPAPDQANLASAFNAAVTEARRLDLQPNYAALYQANQDRWKDDKLADGVTLACPNPNTSPGIPPGYFASLWDRCAYYSRDYVHQSIGAYYLGYYDQNYTMLNNFARLSHVNGGVNAPYWAISATGLAYEQGDELPAPYELGENIAKLYRLTADSRYLGQNFTNYIAQMTSYANAFSNVNGANGSSNNPDGFRMARTQNGETATYNEKVPPSVRILLGGDLATSQIAYYRAISNYPGLATQDSASRYNTLLANFNSHWYFPERKHFAVGLTGNADTYYSSSSNPNYSSLIYYDTHIQEPNIFPLYKGVITDPEKIKNQANYVDTSEENNYNSSGQYLGKPGIEYHTYLPTSFYNANMPDKAWKWLTRLAKWQLSNGNATYPEVPFTFISDVITKVLGIDYDAPNSVLSTYSGLPSTFVAGNFVTISNIPVFNSSKNTTINVNITQRINSSGANETAIVFATDLTTVAFNQGFHWAPKFYNPTGKQHCTLTRTFRSGQVDTLTLNLTTDSTTHISTCVDISNIGIWVYTGPNANISAFAATLAP